VDLDEVRCSTPDGRQLWVQAAPESAGCPVFVHPGSPGSRHLFEPSVDRAAERGLRLIAWDRPGYGDTPGSPGRSMVDGAREAEAVASALGLPRFATWGVSGGGSFALACAALLPDMVSGAVVIASLAPYDAQGLDWAGQWQEASRAEVRLFFDDPATARENFRTEAAEFYESLATAEGWFTRWGDDAGKDAAHSLAVAEHLALVFRDSLKNGDEGWWEDWVAQLTAWGFDVGDIRVPVQLWHGVNDSAVPIEHGRWLAEHIPGVDAHLVDGEDHTNIEAHHEAEALCWLAARAEPTRTAS
jgi:pimeloyl-ACP methyl ester carboxylesterase